MKRALQLLLVLSTLIGMCFMEIDQYVFAQEDNSIRVAFRNAPDNFDPDHPSADWTVTAVTNHVYEGLFEMDDNNVAQPHLATGFSIENDDKTYVIDLREDVKFSDGEILDADDVVASMERWFKVNPAGADLNKMLESIEKTSDYQLKVTFKEPVAAFINMIASPVSRQKLIMKKKEIIEQFQEEIITEHIGTGPYKFEEINMGQNVVLVRNEEYVPVETGASGLSGKREALLDKITIEFVSEESTRIAGLKSGEFDFIDEVSTERYEEIDKEDGISPIMSEHGTIGLIAFNSGRAPFDDKKMRQAVTYMVDPTEMAMAQVGDERFWTIEDGSWFKKDNFWWDGEAGKGIYNSKDIEKAMKLVEESFYDGTPIVLLGTKDDNFKNAGLLMVQQALTEAGVESEVQMYDEATFFDKQNNGEWDLVISRWSDMNPDPQVFEPWTGTNGWITNWDDEESKQMDEIFDRMSVEVDPEERYKIVQEFYNYFWETVPYVKLFNDKRLYAINDNLEGYANYGQPFFWNVNIKE